MATANKSQKTNSASFKAGLAFLATACVFWLTSLVIPFLSIDIKTKVFIISILVILGEVTFWLSAVFLGKEFLQKYKKRLNFKRWRKK